MSLPIQTAPSRPDRERPLWRRAFVAETFEAIVLFVMVGFLLLYGLVPTWKVEVAGREIQLSRDALGLVGADEPRYAQVAREMLDSARAACAPVKARHLPWLQNQIELRSCYLSHSITPILYGKPWLEKPALYYWRAMFAFNEFGETDWAARVPSASFAITLILLIYLHMRRFRPGGQLDAALITASCAGIVGFARGASTDMQLAAPFGIAMLGWYAWYETDRKFWLFDLYFFIGVATLAKGPVAPAMALIILFLFTALRREWSLLRRTIWLPGIILYLAMVLPWFIAVQRRNPNFLRVFFLEHNLERFATNRYQHEQKLWYYVPVVLLALMPWTVIALTALTDSIKMSINEWRSRRAKDRYIGMPRAGDAFPEFLVLWALFPIVFFTFSTSKLPGYILPAIPPITILCADYLNRICKQGLKTWLLVLHAVTVGLLTTAALLLPQQIVHPDTWPARMALVAAIASGLGVALLILVLVARFGVSRLRFATMVPVVLILAFLLSNKVGHLLDLTYSARPMIRMIDELPRRPQLLAVYKTRRDMEYGLSFYRNHRVTNYVLDGVPAEEHLVVVRADGVRDLPQLLAGRTYDEVFGYPAQNLVVFKVGAIQPVVPAASVQQP